MLVSTVLQVWNVDETCGQALPRTATLACGERLRLLGRGRRRSYNYRSKHHDILLLPSDTAHAQGRNCRYWAPSSMLVTARFHSVSIISIFAKHAFPTCSARDPGLQKYRGPFTLLQFRPLHFMWPFLCLSCLAAQEIMQAPQLASRLTLGGMTTQACLTRTLLLVHGGHRQTIMKTTTMTTTSSSAFPTPSQPQSATLRHDCLQTWKFSSATQRHPTVLVPTSGVTAATTKPKTWRPSPRGHHRQGQAAAALHQQ